jgi:haloacetate dehalogenase
MRFTRGVPRLTTNPFGGGSFGPEVKAEYLETYRDPTRVHAICEEYHAAAEREFETLI